MSPLSLHRNGGPIRGGVPIVFPQFSLRTLPGIPTLPQHGLVRTMGWQVHAERTEDDRARIAARVSDDARSRAVWPHRFTLDLVTTAWAGTLDMRLRVRNVGDQPVGFAVAMHTYLRVGRVPAVTIAGLDGLAAHDNRDGTPWQPPGLAMPCLGPLDATLDDAFPHRTVVLHDPDLGDTTLTAEGFTDLVVWNPGPAHRLPDVPPDGASGFVCLEPARLRPVRLEPGAAWAGSQRLVTGPQGGDAAD